MKQKRTITEETRSALTTLAESHPTWLAEVLLDGLGGSLSKLRTKRGVETLRIACGLDLAAHDFDGPCHLGEILGGAPEAGEVLETALKIATTPNERYSLLTHLADYYKKRHEWSKAFHAMLELARLVYKEDDDRLDGECFAEKRVGLKFSQLANVDASEFITLMDSIGSRHMNNRELHRLIGNRPDLFSGAEEHSDIYGYGPDNSFVVEVLKIEPASRLGIYSQERGKYSLRKLAVGGLDPSELPPDLNDSVVLLLARARRKRFTPLAVYQHGQFYADATRTYSKVERVWAVLTLDGEPVRGWGGLSRQWLPGQARSAYLG